MPSLIWARRVFSLGIKHSCYCFFILWSAMESFVKVKKFDNCQVLKHISCTSSKHAEITLDLLLNSIILPVGEMKQNCCVWFHWPWEMVARSPCYLSVWQFHTLITPFFILFQTTELFEAVVSSLPEAFSWNFLDSCQLCLLCETAKEVVTDWFAVSSICC